MHALSPTKKNSPSPSPDIRRKRKLPALVNVAQGAGEDIPKTNGSKTPKRRKKEGEKILKIALPIKNPSSIFSGSISSPQNTSAASQALQLRKEKRVFYKSPPSLLDRDSLTTVNCLVKDSKSFCTGQGSQGIVLLTPNYFTLEPKSVIFKQLEITDNEGNKAVYEGSAVVSSKSAFIILTSPPPRPPFTLEALFKSCENGSTLSLLGYIQNTSFHPQRTLEPSENTTDDLQKQTQPSRSRLERISISSDSSIDFSESELQISDQESPSSSPNHPEDSLNPIDNQTRVDSITTQSASIKQMSDLSEASNEEINLVDLDTLLADFPMTPLSPSISQYELPNLCFSPSTFFMEKTRENQKKGVTTPSFSSPNLSLEGSTLSCSIELSNGSRQAPNVSVSLNPQVSSIGWSNDQLSIIGDNLQSVTKLKITTDGICYEYTTKAQEPLILLTVPAQRLMGENVTIGLVFSTYDHEKNERMEKELVFNMNRSSASI